MDSLVVAEAVSPTVGREGSEQMPKPTSGSRATHLHLWA